MGAYYITASADKILSFLASGSNESLRVGNFIRID